jgi:hypothetical protein
MKLDKGIKFILGGVIIVASSFTSNLGMLIPNEVKLLSGIGLIIYGLIVKYKNKIES